MTYLNEFEIEDGLNLEEFFRQKISSFEILRTKGQRPYAVKFTNVKSGVVVVKCVPRDFCDLEDVGVLKFVKNTPQLSDDSVVDNYTIDKCVIHNEIGKLKRIVTLAGNEYINVGIFLEFPSSLPIIILGGDMPYTIAIVGWSRGGLDGLSEFPWSEYCIVNW